MNNVDFLCLCALLKALNLRSIKSAKDLLRDPKFHEGNKIAYLDNHYKVNRAVQILISDSRLT